MPESAWPLEVVPDDWSGPTYTLAASDLTFLLNDCLRCFYRKVVEGHPRRGNTMPAVFTRLDHVQRAFFDQQNTDVLHPGLPVGTIQCLGLRSVASEVFLPREATTVGLRVRGSLDAVLSFANGSFGVVDFKTSSPAESKANGYSPQLHAYALALERPEAPVEPITPISRIGIVCFDPIRFERQTRNVLTLRTEKTWIEVPVDRANFAQLLERVAQVVARPVPPPASSRCGWCAR